MTDNTPASGDFVPNDRIRIPVEVSTPSADDESLDAMVRDYEAKYSGFRDAEPARSRLGIEDDAPAKPKRTPPTNAPLRYTVHGANVTEEERMWAAIAHGSAVLTLLLGVFTGGIAALFTLFIPLGIYFSYRQRSEYVAYAALQAFAVQVLGTVGWVAVLVTGILAGALLSVLLAVTIVGALLVPIVVLAIILFVLASFALPLGMVVYGAIASWETYQGNWYRYPWVGTWIDRQLQTGFLATL